MRNPHPGSRWPRPHTSNMHRVISIHPEDEAQVPVLEVVPIAFVAGSFCSGANWNIFRMSRIFTDDKWLERIRLPGIPICHGHGHWRISTSTAMATQLGKNFTCAEKMTHLRPRIDITTSGPCYLSMIQLIQLIQPFRVYFSGTWGVTLGTSEAVNTQLKELRHRKHPAFEWLESPAWIEVCPPALPEDFFAVLLAEVMALVKSWPGHGP